MGYNIRVRRFLIVSGAFILTVAVMTVVLLQVETLRSSKSIILVTLAEGYTHNETAEVVSIALGWDEYERERFVEAMTGIKWDRFNDTLASYLSNRLGWDDAQREVFLTRSTLLFSADTSLIEAIYVPGEYSFSGDATPAIVAEVIVNRVVDENSNLEAFLNERIDRTLAASIQDFVNEQLREDVELTPDLVLLPPEDVSIRKVGDLVFLGFSTTYYNVGEGPLELVADVRTAGIKDDIQRTVFQRIYKTDGTYRDTPSGTFLWHEAHLHYHFADFVTYSLEATDGTKPLTREIVQEKSTFCVRDVSKIRADNLPTGAASYLVCGKEIQGVSVGWGDTYFHTYPGQLFNITGVPSGTYVLKFVLNPQDRFEEISEENNTAWAVVKIDKQKLKVEVLELYPSDAPDVDHVYKEESLRPRFNK